jgi:simple sugar transport system permease protein
MTAGRGWIAIALVIFATWSPARAALGAYLFTILVLVLATRETVRRRIGAPAALGLPYYREERS